MRERTTTLKGPPMRILVVEDEDAIADFLVAGLRAEGYEVNRAANGIEGEKLALAGPWLYG